MVQGPSPRSSTPRSRHESAGERRTITILFCDVAGSTALAENFDPEEWVEIMNEVFEYLNEPIHRYGGTVARLMGDGILAFFGAPTSHEDDPERAALAGLDILEGIDGFRKVFRRDCGLDFNVRIGINTGPVVVGQVGSEQAGEYTAMGDAVNMAARMEQTATPGTIQISDDTFRLIAPLFDAEPLGGVEVKGKSEPVTSYRVLSHKAVPGRTRGIEGLSVPMVGRENEMNRLRQALADVRRGHGAIVTIIGEAGLGKSRLIDELRGESGNDDSPEINWILIQGVSYDSSRPYGLFVHQLRRSFGVEETESPETLRDKIDSALPNRPSEGRAGVVAAVAHLLSPTSGPAGPHLDGEAVKRQMFEALLGVWRRMPSPTVFVAEDIHWADPASIELLTHLLQLVEEVPIVYICAFRPEREAPSWQVKVAAETHYPRAHIELDIDALSTEESSELFGSLLSVDDLPDQVRETVLAKADGNPLFVEEFTRALIDTGAVTAHDGGAHWHADINVEQTAIPENLQALLTARIDQLDEGARRTLQLCSVMGRSFYRRILEQVSDSGGALDKDLDTLQAAGLIREAASVPEVEYIFRHDLTRDAAYDSLLFRRRRRFHRQVGEAMEDLFEGRLEEHAHRLAHHFHETADNDRALKYSAMAGDIAAGLYANDEAITHYARAIELAREAGPAELPRLLEALGDVKRSLGSASESSLLYEEASQLLSNKDDNSREVRVRGKAALSAITAGDLEKATSLLQATLETVSEDWSELAVAHTYYELSQLHWHSSRHGDALEAAQQSLEAALASGDVKEESHAYEAMALACHSLGDWQMGIEYELRRSALGDSGFDVDEAFDAHL